MVRALDAGTGYPKHMEFRRINNLPPYVFTITMTSRLKAEEMGMT